MFLCCLVFLGRVGSRSTWLCVPVWSSCNLIVGGVNSVFVVCWFGIDLGFMFHGY